MNLIETFKTLNLRGSQEFGYKRNAATIEMAFARWKEMTVEASRTGDQAQLRRLSQAHEALKRAQRKFCTCGKRKNPLASQCPACSAAAATVPLPLPETGALLGPEIPKPLRNRPMQQRLSLLTEVGLCIELRNTRPYRIINTARSLQMIVTMRRKAPGVYHVWRTDGKTPEVVNEIIRAKTKTNDEAGRPARMEEAC